MRKVKWANFCGDILALSTVTSVALASNHFSKKYGQKYQGIHFNTSYLIDYGFNRFLGDGTKLNDKLKTAMAKK